MWGSFTALLARSIECSQRGTGVRSSYVRLEIVIRWFLSAGFHDSSLEHNFTFVHINPTYILDADAEELTRKVANDKIE